MAAKSCVRAARIMGKSPLARGPYGARMSFRLDLRAKQLGRRSAAGGDGAPAEHSKNPLSGLGVWADDRQVLARCSIVVRRKVWNGTVDGEPLPNCLRCSRDDVPAAHAIYLSPPAMTRITGLGSSSGRRGGKSQNRALHELRGSQSADNRTIKSSGQISGIR
jgi:hypothetical protein